MLDDLALVVEPEDVDSGPFGVGVPGPELPAMQHHVIALRYGALELDLLAGILARHALEVGDERFLAVGDLRVVLDVPRAGEALHRLARPGLVEHQVIERHRVALVSLEPVHYRAPGTLRVFRNSPNVSPRNAATISGLDTPFTRASFSRQKKLAPWSCIAFQSRRRTICFSSSVRPCIASSGASRKRFRFSATVSPCRNRFKRSPRALRSRSKT